MVGDYRFAFLSSSAFHTELYNMAFLYNRTRAHALCLLGIGSLCLLAASGSSLQGAEPAQKRILILTGEDYPGHKWQETTPVVKEQLAKDDRWVVEVIDDLKWLRDGKLDQYDAVVMHFKNYDPAVPGPAGQRNLEQYVRAGGGLVLLHFACGAFQEWPEFVNIAGRVWNPQMRDTTRTARFVSRSPTASIRSPGDWPGSRPPTNSTRVSTVLYRSEFSPNRSPR